MKATADGTRRTARGAGAEPHRGRRADGRRTTTSCPPLAPRGRIALTRDGARARGASASAQSAHAPLVVAIAGDLGAGKTTLVQAICRGAGVHDRGDEPDVRARARVPAIASPIYHLDLYRLERPEDLTNLGWDDILRANALVLVEWPERGGDAHSARSRADRPRARSRGRASGGCLLRRMSGVLTLALEAATSTGSRRGAARRARCSRQREVAMRGGAEERLLPPWMPRSRRRGVASRDLARIVCGAGPGSFTSLRVAGVASRRGSRSRTRIPLFAVPSLALIAADRDRSPRRIPGGARCAARRDVTRAATSCARRTRSRSSRQFGSCARCDRARCGALRATVIGPEERAAHLAARGECRRLGDVAGAPPVSLASVGA